MRRVIVILTDGLRPEAVDPGIMPSLTALGDEYTLAARATTVRPSTTVAALASLATGVHPNTHGLIEPGLRFLRGLPALRPVARVLASNDMSSAVVTGKLGRGELIAAKALAAAAGVGSVTVGGDDAPAIARSAIRAFERGSDGLLFIYLPDCDRAGHAHGWMSQPYLAAAARIDVAISTLSALVDRALLIVLADHGGGGVYPTEHDEPHATNDAIPLIVAGVGARRGHRIRRAVSLLDVPATILWHLGAPVPAIYEGRALREAFARAQRVPEVAA